MLETGTKNCAMSMVCICAMAVLALSGTASGQTTYTYEHGDPAGDVTFFNATINGTPAENVSGVAYSEYEGLDIKWLDSGDDGAGNVEVTIDLKSKEKFRNENETKYVIRLYTTADNRTGYNITYKNHTATINSFGPPGDGSAEDILANTSFPSDKGDEMMVVSVSIAKYLGGAAHFGVDAYSIRTTHNATFLDYNDAMPGHPTYINPDNPPIDEVTEGEDEEGEPTESESEGPGEDGEGSNEDGAGSSDEDDGEDDGGLGSALPLALIAVFAIAAVVLLAVLMTRRKKKEGPTGPQASQTKGK